MKDADGVLPTEVTIEVSAPSGYVEDESANNRAVITLGPSDSEPPAMPTIDVTPSWDSNGNSGSGTAAVTISAPDDVSMELTVVATGDELDYSALPTGCEIQTDGSILCSFTGGTEFSMGLSFVDTTGNEPREATVIFTVSVPGRAGTASDSVTLCRFCGDQSGGDGNAATSGIVTAARLEGESPG
jgi:hypothetical protein